MNYLIQASDFDANSLLRTAQEHFDMVRQNPFLRGELVHQGYLEFPDGHPKLPHLWPVKLPQARRSNYGVSGLRAMREAASLSR